MVNMTLERHTKSHMSIINLHIWTVSEVLKRLKDEDIEVSTFEMKSRSTKDGEVFDVSADIRVKRGGHNERILNLINEFDDVTISHLE